MHNIHIFVYVQMLNIYVIRQRGVQLHIFQHMAFTFLLFNTTRGHTLTHASASHIRNIITGTRIHINIYTNVGKCVRKYANFVITPMSQYINRFNIQHLLQIPIFNLCLPYTYIYIQYYASTAGLLEAFKYSLDILDVCLALVTFPDTLCESSWRNLLISTDLKINGLKFFKYWICTRVHRMR